MTAVSGLVLIVRPESEHEGVLRYREISWM